MADGPVASGGGEQYPGEPDRQSPAEAGDRRGGAGGHGWLRRHRLLVVVGVVIILIAPVTWYLGSPLFINKTVVEEFPTAAPAPGGTLPGTSNAGVTATASPATPVQTGPVVLATGQLRGVGHTSSGTATIFHLADGQRVLRLDHDTQNGPDLFVWLIAADDYTGKADAEDYVDLGRLKGNQGQQNYEVPPGTDLDKYRTMMIWCKRFSTPFAAAPLAVA